MSLSEKQLKEIRLFIACIDYLRREADQEDLPQLARLLAGVLHQLGNWLKEEKIVSGKPAHEDIFVNEILGALDFLYGYSLLSKQQKKELLRQITKPFLHVVNTDVAH